MVMPQWRMWTEPAGINRRMLPDNAIRIIRHQTMLKTTTTDHSNICWELTLAIPLKAFYFHELTTMSQIACRVNFYKCGDDFPIHISLFRTILNRRNLIFTFVIFLGWQNSHK
jgi:hypothetical protein